jgi:uncharacterized protein (DUF305 family)
MALGRAHCGIDTASVAPTAALTPGDALLSVRAHTISNDQPLGRNFMHTTTRSRRALAATAAALLATFGLAACSDDSTSVEAAHNHADVAFASDMIPHHAQALEMAQMVEGEDVSPEVLELAEEIEAAQDPEIEQMTSWLEQWGEEVPDSSMGGMDHSDMDMGSSDKGMSMSGMMTAEDMAALEAADGEQFEQMWLSMMIAHHQGAIAMAQTEQTEGESTTLRSSSPVRSSRPRLRRSSGCSHFSTSSDRLRWPRRVPGPPCTRTTRTSMEIS